MISAVLLDVGGVLVLPNTDELLPAVLAFAPAATIEDLSRGHYHGVAAMDKAALAKGVTADWRSYNRAVVTALGVAADQHAAAVDALVELMSGVHWNTVIPGAIDAMRDLAALGVALGIVSNSNGTVEALLLESKVCQVGAGDGVTVGVVIDSGAVGVEKPRPEIFDHALAALGVSAAEAIHVGDTGWADVAGAIAAGVRPVHVDPFGLCDDDEHTHVAHVSEVVALVKAERAGA